MKTILLMVGKTVSPNFVMSINDYLERIKHYMPFEIITIPEIKNTKNLSEDQQKEREGDLILKSIQQSDTVVLLDEHGKEMRSIEFAKWTEAKRMTLNGSFLSSEVLTVFLKMSIVVQTKKSLYRK